jgi:hypothetical protein
MQHYSIRLGTIVRSQFHSKRIFDTKTPNKHMSIFQIGAHTGWNENDPLMKGMTLYLQSLPQERRQRVDCTLVEASPANHAALEKKVQEHSSLCDLKSLHAGIVPDSAESTNLTFHGISADINVKTGLDSRSGKKLIIWASQLSSFSKQNILKH